MPSAGAEANWFIGSRGPTEIEHITGLRLAVTRIEFNLFYPYLMKTYDTLAESKPEEAYSKLSIYHLSYPSPPFDGS